MDANATLAADQQRLSVSNTRLSEKCKDLAKLLHTAKKSSARYQLSAIVTKNDDVVIIGETCQTASETHTAEHKICKSKPVSGKLAHKISVVYGR